MSSLISVLTDASRSLNRRKLDSETKLSANMPERSTIPRLLPDWPSSPPDVRTFTVGIATNSTKRTAGTAKVNTRYHSLLLPLRTSSRKTVPISLQIIATARSPAGPTPLPAARRQTHFSDPAARERGPTPMPAWVLHPISVLASSTAALPNNVIVQVRGR